MQRIILGNVNYNKFFMHDQVPLLGYLRNLKIYSNRALDASQIKNMYNYDEKGCPP